MPRFSYPIEDVIDVLESEFQCRVHPTRQPHALSVIGPEPLLIAVLYVEPHEVLLMSLRWLCDSLKLPQESVVAALDRAVDPENMSELDPG